jgi:putative transposase
MSAAPRRFLRMIFAGWVNRRQLEIIDYLKAENLVLREQLGGRRLRFTDDQRRRLAVKGRVLGRRVLHELAELVTPDRFCAGTASSSPTSTTVLLDVELVVLARRRRFGSSSSGSPRRTRGWGYTPILGAPRNLGHALGRDTIKRILLEHGVEPAPSRGRRMPWKTFLTAHLGSIAATDFFTVEVLTLAGLVRYFVLFVIEIETRRVQIAGIVRQPHGTWMKQIARNLTDNVEGFLQGMRYLNHDRDPLFTDEFGDILQQLITTAAPYQTPANDDSPVVRRERLGGLLNFYTAARCS